ncbi:MAG: hypothetical protein ACRDZO_18760 [Egibacteraceae bacterium]
MTGKPRHEARLLDFRALVGRLRVAAGLLALCAVVGVIVDGLRSGLTFAVMVRWVGIFAVAMLVVAAGLVAIHAFRGAERAQRRGESLSGSDVGLIPPRRPRE